MKFRDQVEQEMGIELPPLGEPLPADVEKRISELVAEAASRVTQKAMMEAEQQRINEQMQDPLIQAKQAEVAVKEAEVQRKAQADAARLQLAAQKQQDQKELEERRISSQEQIAGANIGQKIASDLLDSKLQNKKQAAKEFKEGVDIAKDIVKDINTSD